MSLRDEMQELGKALSKLSARVQLDEAAEQFIASNHEIREGDYFVLPGQWPTRLDNVSSDGKWTFQERDRYIEPFVRPTDVQRLYTIAEVAEIVAKVRR